VLAMVGAMHRRGPMVDNTGDALNSRTPRWRTGDL